MCLDECFSNQRRGACGTLCVLSGFLVSSNEFQSPPPDGRLAPSYDILRAGECGMLSVQCPSCAKKLKVADKLAGKRNSLPRLRQQPVSAAPTGVTKENAPTREPPSRAPQPGTGPSGPAARRRQRSRRQSHAFLPAVSTITRCPGAAPAPPPKQLVDFLAILRRATTSSWPDSGPYRVLKVLGHGGMGVVFLAEDAKLKRKVALKAMLPSIAQEQISASRFLRRSLQAMAHVKHAHVATIYQVDEDQGVPYLAMELLVGEPLDVLLKRQPILPIPEVLRIGREIAEGLAAAPRPRPDPPRRATSSQEQHLAPKAAKGSPTTPPRSRSSISAWPGPARAMCKSRKAARSSAPRPTWRRNRPAAPRWTVAAISSASAWSSTAWRRAGSRSRASIPSRR